MSDFEQTLLDGFEKQSHLQTILECYFAEGGDQEELPLCLAKLHNDGTFDFVKTISEANTNEFAGPSFFTLMRIFEQALPSLEAPISTVIEAVVSLHKEAGNDLAAGTVFDGYIEFCRSNPEEISTGFKIVTQDKFFYPCLNATLIAGAELSSEEYLKHAIRLADSDEDELSVRALRSIGRMEWSNGSPLFDQIIELLERRSGEEDNDIVRSAVIWTAYELSKRNSEVADRLSKTIERAVSKLGDMTLHSASEILGFNWNKLSAEIIELLLSYLQHVKPTSRGTIDRLDQGLRHLIETENSSLVFGFLEAYLTKHSDEISLEDFDSLIHKIRSDASILRKITTRWLWNGDKGLCKSIHRLIALGEPKGIPVEVDEQEIDIDDPKRQVFFARKIVGYLFFQPITASSMLVSLIRLASDKDIRRKLGGLLFDPVLINFTGEARDFVAEQAKLETGATKRELNNVLQSIEDYLDALRQIGDLPELHPSTSQMEIYHRHFSNMVAVSMKEAEEKSVLASLFEKQMILYGTKSIFFVRGPEGQSTRSEIPMNSYSSGIEFPRAEHLDPFGLDYLLRTFRAEHRPE